MNRIYRIKKTFFGEYAIYYKNYKSDWFWKRVWVNGGYRCTFGCPVFAITLEEARMMVHNFKVRDEGNKGTKNNVVGYCEVIE